LTPSPPASQGPTRHGGRLAEAAAAFPAARKPWLDLSTGINPQAWRGPRAALGELRRLPDPQGLAALEAAAARAFGADPACVAAVAGAEAGLRLAPRLTGARSVAIGAFTYGGHAQAWEGVARASADRAEAMVVVNPNNPDGAISAPAALADGRRWLVVDESFVEVAPGLSVAGAGLPRTLVLRSFGKFYGLPGVRLGFVVAEPDVAVRTRALVGDWPVSADAVAMGTRAYADDGWAQASRARLAADARRLDALLAAAGFEAVGGTDLFRLVRSPDAAARFRWLARQGVLTRPFDDDPSLLRFGLPGRDGWNRLIGALKSF
jgi:cobalamin biosynthetic protein CobC